MKQAERANQRKRAERLYASCLHLYPRVHREAYGQLMLQAFRDSYRDALTTHGHTGTHFWLGLVGDEAKSLLREHGTAIREGAERLKQRRLVITSGLILTGGVVVSLAACAR